MRRWEYGDPALVLERRGQDCDNCIHLEQWDALGRRLSLCTNPRAPEKLKRAAPARRCEEWQHKGETA